MIKAIRRPKEYTVIKIPVDCKEVGRYVSEEVKKMHLHIPMDISTDYTVDDCETDINGWTVMPGDAIVIDPDDLCDGNLHVLRPDMYSKYFEEKPHVVSADGGTVISGGTIGSETHIRLGNHIYATIGPNGLTVTDTGDGATQKVKYIGESNLGGVDA